MTGQRILDSIYAGPCDDTDSPISMMLIMVGMGHRRHSYNYKSTKRKLVPFLQAAARFAVFAAQRGRSGSLDYDDITPCPKLTAPTRLTAAR